MVTRITFADALFQTTARVTRRGKFGILTSGMFNPEVNTARFSFLIACATVYESDCGACATRTPSPPSPSLLNIVNPIHTSTSRECMCKPPLALSEIIALHDTFACSCTNAQSSGDSCAARGPQLCLIAARKTGGSFANPFYSLVLHSRRTGRIRGV